MVRVVAASANAYDWHFLTADTFLIRFMGGELLKPEDTRLGADISGASRVTINMNGTLNVDLSGASRLRYTGDVEMGAVSISGASTMNRL